MKILSVIALSPLLLLAACGGGAPQPAAPTSSSAVASSAAPVVQTAPASDDSLAPLVGTWALDPAQCVGDQTLKISKTRFEGPGSACDVSGYADNGDGTFTASVSCKGAAETIQMRPIFGPTGEGIDLVYLNRDKLKSTVLRCPTPKK